MSAVRTLWLKRPRKANALRLEDIVDLRLALEEAVADVAVAGIVIAGRGHNFSGGVDLAEFAEGSPARGAQLIAELEKLCETVLLAPKPVAVAVQGACVGGALELALAADFRVATATARFSMPEVFLGIPSVIHASLLERYVGLGRAHEMLLTGEPMEATEALACGLVNRVVAEAQLLPAAEELIALTVRHDAAAITTQKRLFREWLELSFGAGLASSRGALVRHFESGVPAELARKRLP